MPKKSNKSLSWDRGGYAVPSMDNKRCDKHYSGHDDRVPRLGMGQYLGGTRPRVSFKTQRPNKQIRRNVILANLDQDTPMAMGSMPNNNTRQVTMRERGRGSGSRGRNSPLPNRNFQGGQSGSRARTNRLGESDWYKICIPYGHKYEKDYVLRSLSNYMAPEVFIPITYKVMDNRASFYVDDRKAANALANCDRKITTTDGFKLQVRVKPWFPQTEGIDDKLRERLKQAMEKRYRAETNALDLSKFHQDVDLVADYFCALFRPTTLTTVLDIVAAHIPTLEALSLEGNKIHKIQGLSVLSKKFPKLKILYIGDNKIQDINQIDALKNLKLEELRLQGNPLCERYKSRQTDYVSDVRKRFPKLMLLDGTELPRPILFDVNDETVEAPSSQRTYATSTKAYEIAGQFLQQYFILFDSDNRQPLLNAYTEHACFSLTSTYKYSKMSGYLSENRNLFRVNDSTGRTKLLKNGKLPIVSFLSEMPQTKHFLDSFTMDITLPTPTMMFVTLTGCFQEMNNKEQLIRYFNRTFVIVPEGAGYCICNEQMHVSQPTDEQLKTQLSQSEQPTSLLLQGSTEQPAPQTSVEQAPQMPTAVAAKPMESTALREEIKQQMVVALSQQTNMNLEWSYKCLNEVQWNYDNALSAAHKMKVQYLVGVFETI